MNARWIDAERLKVFFFKMIFMVFSIGIFSPLSVINLRLIHDFDDMEATAQ